MAADRTEMISRGTAASRATTRRSTLRGTPVRRSRLNGLFRSLTPPVTLTARLQPAMTRLAAMTTLVICWSSVMLRVLLALISLSVWGGF